MNFLHQILSIVVHISEWIFSAVILKYIIGKWIAERILNVVNKIIKKNDRYRIIFNHYIDQAKGIGHSAGHVLSCSDGTCSTLKRVLN